jgi:hypothetical protein
MHPSTRPTTTSFISRKFSAVPGLLASLFGLGAFVCASSARADLVAPFLDRIDVDPTYVTNATGATDIAWATDGRAVITQKNGTIVVRQTNGSQMNRSGVFAGVSMSAEQGLLGVVADPTAANTFYFYVSNGSESSDRHRVLKAVLAADNSFAVDATPVIAASRNLGLGLAGPANHNGGGLAIYQNRLYVGVGDTGANATPPTNKFSSCLNRPNGKILRVALDGTVPSDNPLANVTQVTACDSTTGAWTTAMPDRRIYAWGFRNPWRFWVDPTSGRMWVGDVGETTREEISVGTGDSHFGYPFFEGNQDWSMSGGMLRLQKSCNTDFLPGRPCTPAVHDYPRSGTGGGTCVTGGLIPDGCGWSTALGGTMYLFADYNADWIHGLTVTNRMMGTASSTATNLGSFNNSGPVSFRMGPDESLYVVMNQGNAVYRFTPRDRTGCMGGMGGAGGAGGAPPGGGAGTGTTAGMGGIGMGGQAGAAGPGGVAGVGMGGEAGTVGPGGVGMGGATAGTGATSGAGGAGVGTGGTVPSGGVGPSGGAPVGGAPGGGLGPTAGTGGGNDIDTGSGCGCRAAKPSGVGYVALALGLVLTIGARLRRRRRRGE